MLAYVFIPAVWAAPLSSGVQVAAYQSSLDFIEERIEGEVVRFEQDDVQVADVACFDAVGIRNLNIEMPIDFVELDLKPDSIEIDILFGRIHGEEMMLYGQDTDVLDPCVGFETNFHGFEVLDGRVLIEVAPSFIDGEMVLELVGPPSVGGDVSTDIEWVPDEMVLSFAEKAIFDAIENAIDARLPGLISDMIDVVAFRGEFGDVGFNVDFNGLNASNTALTLGMDVDAEWRGDSCSMPAEVGEPKGRNPALDLSGGEPSDLAVGITEYQINRLFHGAWADGLFCFEAGPLANIGGSLEASIDGPVSNPDATLSIKRAPQFYIEDSGISLKIPKMKFSLEGEIAGQKTPLFEVDADLRVGVELQLEHSISSFVLRLDDIDLDLSDLEIGVLVKDEEEAIQGIRRLIEEWVVVSLPERLNDIPFYGNLFFTRGVYLRVNDIQTEAGGLYIKGDLYDETDPEVDTEAPDTFAEYRGQNDSTIRVFADASDNKNGPFAFSTRVDSGPWSDWSDDTVHTLPAPEPGDHVVEVRARDAWLNVDPTPAKIRFTVEAEPEQEQKGCACAAQRAPFQGMVWSLFAILMGLSRRRE